MYITMPIDLVKFHTYFFDSFNFYEYYCKKILMTMKSKIKMKVREGKRRPCIFEIYDTYNTK